MKLAKNIKKNFLAKTFSHNVIFYQILKFCFGKLIKISKKYFSSVAPLFNKQYRIR